jgi:F-type H+-transporting ATPase subunit a
MINNLFSIFDPSTSIYSISWTILIIPLLILTIKKQKINLNSKINITRLITPLKKELNSLINPYTHKRINIIILYIFLILFTINLLALTPFVFTPTAHIIIILPTTLIMWTGIILFGWINNTKKIISHIIPNGTPIILINFIVLIELTRNLIRPFTLAIRLVANIVAGHLLLRLLNNFTLNSTSTFIISSTLIILLNILELAVAIIQAYVIITLLTLYTTEIH